MGLRQQSADVDMIDVFEQMLFQRAVKGLRPVLYVSSYTDLECNMLMLLDEDAKGQISGQQPQVAQKAGYHIAKN